MNKSPLAAVSVLLLFWVASCSWDGNSGLRDQQAEGEPPQYLVPESVSKVAWEWSAPEGVSVSDVLPVPSGAALAVADGVIVLDGAEGEELWSHRETDTSKPEIAVAAGGEMVVLDFPSSSAGESVLDVRTVVLDSGTGQALGEYEQAGIEGTGQETIQGYGTTVIFAVFDCGLGYFLRCAGGQRVCE